MQSIIFQAADSNVKRGDVLPVYMENNIICHFKVESFTETQVIGDFTMNVEANLQFTVARDAENELRVIPAP
ncbi:MAG TPA: hypothetical protein PLY34_21385 [Ferruginibacter sp.]|jgi:hypothetical protein|nr:hypothetical protein [Ferruginibacter sp.]HPH93251.1 hypothetical protein [Ferruginibacter sp.]